MIYEAKLTCAQLSPAFVWLSVDSAGGGSNVELLNYIPTSGQSESDITETIEIGATFANLRATITTLERFFQAAREESADVYLEMRINESAWHRSRVHNGAAQVGNFSFWLNAAHARASITIQHEFGWQGPESELALTNGGGSGTGGRTVGNENFSTTENWVTIAGAAVAGDLPAVARIELTANYAGGSGGQKEIWMHHKVDSPTTFVHFLQGEDSAGSPNVSDSAASGGSKRSVSWSGTAKTKFLELTLTAASLNAMAGGQAQLLLRRDGSAYTDMYYQFQIRNPTGFTLIHEGALTPMTGQMQIIDTLRLPPGGLISGSSDLVLELWGQRLTSGSHTQALDFIQICPVGPGNSWQKLTCTGNGLLNGQKLVVDNIENRVYRVVSGVNVPDWTTQGGGIQLQPGRDQRLYVLSQEVGSAYRRLQTYSIRVYYRPRRRSL